MKRITAQDLYNLTKCPHRVYLDANGDPREKGEVSPFVTLLWELGLQIEREYIGTVGGLAVSDLSTLSIDGAWSETLRLMNEGAALIYQGALIVPPFVGRPDLLLKRTKHPSSLGDYLYEPIDIKAGVGWEKRGGKITKFKKHYAFQVLFYRMMLERIQGTSLPVARIVNVDKEIEEFDPVLFEAEFRQALTEAQRLVGGEVTSEPVLGSQCQLCPWHRRCERWVEERSDPSGLFFVGRQKFQLKEVGLQTIQDIARMQIDEYLHAPKKIARMGEKSLRRMKERARVKLSGRPKIQQGYQFPRAVREVYFDIEDDPTRGLTYLFGLLIKNGDAEPRFRYFVACRPEEEEQTVRAFWDYLGAGGGEVYYVYSHKERTTLKQLMERYDLDPTIFEAYVAKEYDLYSRLVVEYSDWPTYSYGIKQIAKMVGFRWRDPDPSGVNSIAWYNEYLANPSNDAALTRILRYNEDDCLAMVAVKEYFQAAMDTESGISPRQQKPSPSKRR